MQKALRTSTSTPEKSVRRLFCMFRNCVLYPVKHLKAWILTLLGHSAFNTGTTVTKEKINDFMFQ